MFCTITGIGAIVAAFVQTVYLLLAERKSSPKTTSPSRKKPPVSILICARNEGVNLRQRLPGILSQQYPLFEVVVIDDGSEDETGTVLEELQGRFPHLRYRRISAAEKAFPGKKGALQIAVQEAAHNLLLLTDADCLPVSPFWIEKTVTALSAEKEIGIGYGPYEAAPGALNTFIRAETLLSFVAVKTFHRFGTHYTAVGRNLCVRKETLRRAMRHPLWMKTLSGDDDMLLRICATRENVAVVSNPQTCVYSPAKDSWAAYRAQKQRHLSTGKYYRLPVKALLFLMNGSHVLGGIMFLPVLFCALLHPCALSITGLGFWLLRTVFFILLMRSEARAQRENLSFFSLLLFDAAYAFYPLFFAPYIFFKNKQEWS